MVDNGGFTGEGSISMQRGSFIMEVDRGTRSCTRELGSFSLDSDRGSCRERRKHRL